MRKWFDPFEELKRLQSRLDDLFGEIEGQKELLPAELRDFPVDVLDEPDKVKVVAELPGFKKEDVETAIEDSYLVIKAKKEEEKEEKEKDYFKKERRYGEFRRRIQIPTDVNMDQVSATYKNGVLEVTLPKAEPAKKKRINIQ